MKKSKHLQIWRGAFTGNMYLIYPDGHVEWFEDGKWISRSHFDPFFLNAYEFIAEFK